MKASDLTFGIEIESGIPRQHRLNFPMGQHTRGPQLPIMPEGWQGRSDCSISAPADCMGIELVSPILKGIDGLKEVVYFGDFLTGIGANFNRSMGLHVHVGGHGLSSGDRDTIRRLVRVYTRYEKAFYGLNGEHAAIRWNNTYCAHSPFNGDGFYTRYQGLNLTNLQGPKQTVEFRMFQGTASAESILAAVYMAVGLVAAVCNGHDIPSPIRDRIESPIDAARSLIRQVFIGQVDHRIVPDYDMTTVSSILYRECRRAAI